MAYHIEKHSLSDVLTFGKDRYNSNNHHDVQPIDYKQKLNETNTKNWIDQFHKSYYVIIIDLTANKWLHEANRVGSLLMRVSPLYEDDVEELSTTAVVPESTKGYFVRSEHVSLKNGVHGTGPYNNFRQIIESIITSKRRHSPLHETDSILKLYLLQWVDIFQEFRVFVYEGKITAISQQNLYKENVHLHDNAIELVSKWCDLICSYFDTTIKPKLQLDSYCIDFAILHDGSPYFIEINPFGKEYSSGSALFHWIHDENILYGKMNKIHVRYV